VARGPIVEMKALASSRLWAAGLDAYENEPEITSELLHLDNVVLLPHIGSTTYETRKKMCFMNVKNLLQGLLDEHPENLVEPF